MYKCKNCNREFEKVGPKNLHEYHCTLKAGFSAGEKRKSSPAEKHLGCQHEWRLLGNSLTERIARDNGFIKYCIKCEEVE